MGNNHIKKVFLLLFAVLMISMLSIPTFAAAKKYKVTLVDQKANKSYTMKVESGKTLSSKQIKTAKKKMKSWFNDLCKQKNSNNAGSGTEFKNMYKVSLPGEKSKKTGIYQVIKKNTKIKVTYTKAKAVIRYVSVPDNQIFKRVYISKNKKAPKNPEPPIKKGYEFVNWSGSKEGKKITSLKVYTTKAVYRPITYKITFDGNHATGGKAMETQSVKYGQALTLPKNTYVKKNYTFWYWRGSDGQNYDDGETVKNLTDKNGETIRLTAEWSENKKDLFHITYNYDGGEDPHNKETYDRETSVRLIAPKKKAWEFDGWTGTGIDGQPKDYTVPKGTTGDLSFTAHWKSYAYTVSFEANGGTGNINDYKTHSGDSFPLPQCSFTNQGYVFDGWEDEEGKVFSAGQFVSDLPYGTKNKVVLKARWKEKDKETYYLLYDYDGGELPEGKTNPDHYTTGDNSFILIAPTRFGYNFSGWQRTDIEDQSVYRSVTIDHKINSDRAYRALWTPKSYYIYFDKNGGKGNMGSVLTKFDEEITLPACKFTKDWATFTYWDDKDGNSYTDQQKVMNILKDDTKNKITLYASWSDEDIPEYNITYDIGLANDPGNPTTYKKSERVQISNPTLEGYTFSGWTGTGLSSKTTSLIIPAGSEGDRSYQASFTPISYTVSFDKNGGTSGYMSSATVKYDADYTIPECSFKRTNAEFIQWTDDLGSVYSPGDVVKNLRSTSGIFKLYAQWDMEEVVDFNITYNNLNGGTYSGTGNKRTYTIEDLPFTLSNPTRTGYTFDGWTGAGYDTPTKSLSVPVGARGDLAFTANWTVNKYTVTFNSNSGTGTMSNASVEHDKEYTIPECKFTRSAYIFTGWEAPDGVIYQPGDKVTNLTTSSSVTLKAQWEQDTATYTITYNLGEGVEDPGNPTTYTSNDTIKLLNPSKKAYTFKGWTGTGLTTTSTSVTITKSSGNRTYTANWTPRIYSIYFQKGDASAKGAMSSQSTSGGTVATLKKCEFTYEGHLFRCWTDNTGKEYADEESILDILPIGSTSVTLTAQWDIDVDNQIKLTIDPNTGVYKGNSSKQYVRGKIGSTFILDAPTKNGYKFTGWECTGGGSVSGNVFTYGTTDGTVKAIYTRLT